MTINTNLEKKLTDVLAGYCTIKYKKSDTLVNLLKKSLADIRRQYKKASLGGVYSTCNEWLCDNYYMIEQEGRALLKSIAKTALPCAPDGLAYVYSFVYTATLDLEFEFSTESCTELVTLFEKGRNIQNFELDFLKTAIRISAVEGVRRAVCTNAEQIRKVDSNGQHDGKSDQIKRSELIGKCVTLLFNIDAVDMDQIVKEKNKLDIVLQNDPSGFYSKMNETTKQIYRYKISRIALKIQKDEIELARGYVQEAFKNKEERLKNAAAKTSVENESIRRDHAGFYIYRDYDKLVKSGFGHRVFIKAHWGIPLIFSLTLAFFMNNVWWALLLFFPMWNIIKPALEYICMKGTRGEYAPRLDFSGSIPETAQTLVVISTLLPDVKQLNELRSKLEKLYYTNGKGAVAFMALADLKQAKFPEMPEDKAKIRGCANLIQSLNSKYNNKFMLLVRKRSFSKTGRIYIGTERKRGAIQTLINLIKGGSADYNHFTGDIKKLRTVKYILALDYDTKALLESACSLVSIAEHPLNLPETDDERGIVVSGYGIIAPCMAADLRSSLSTPFTKVMCGAGGVSAYDMQCSNLYQDLYGEGTFTGKGLICVDTFHKMLSNVFLPETVLSHDILEGGFLRTRFVYDIELTDSFPTSAVPFFKRLHRWIRGDFQNIPFILRKINTPDGRIKNPLSGVSKFKLFDNIARELNPVFALMCLFIAFIAPRPIAAALTLTALLATASVYVFSLFFTVAGGGIFALSRKYYSSVLPRSFELLSQTFYNLILLPQFACNALDAAVKGVYRRFISRQKMLEWEPAAGAVCKQDTPSSIFSYFWFGEFIGILLIFSPYGFLRFFGILFALSVFLVYFSGKKSEKKGRHIPEEAREELVSDMAAMWDFFCDYANEKENYLPPDNVQEAPVFRIASRTSPTNIGLLLLSVLCARDFDFIDTAGMRERLENILETISKMEKWRGNLYNWYDNHSLKPLNPPYVSTVDSGNFLCCLVALKEGLREYLDEDIFLAEIIRCIEILIDDADLEIFYNKNKKLFAIGYDAQNEKMSTGYYDTLMSEARMTSYFAIAKRRIPKKHWSVLSRTLTRHNSFTGPVSWTGTMFEYFMPELLLCSYEGSLGYEGLRFCLYCQKRWAKEWGSPYSTPLPYGVSESGFYAFDTQLNYQYKAHGVQKLALKRGMDNDLVVSPYSTYLALGHDFNSAFKNLQELKKLGVSGRYGHYEAIDFTRSRVGGTHGQTSRSRYRIVKSYMSHHVGMSIVAAANALSGNIMQKRFLNDKFMQSARELLQEKISEGAVIYQGIYRKENFAKNIRETAEELEYKFIYPHAPRVKLLSNGELTSIITDSGSDYTFYQGQDITRRPQDLLRRPNGIFAALKTETGIIPFTFAPDYGRLVKRSVVFSADSVTYLAENSGFSCGMLKLLHPTLALQQIEFAVKNTAKRRRKSELFIYLEPTLAPFEDDAAHPAFSKLFVKIEYDRTAQVLTAERKRRKNEKTVYLAVGFLEDTAFEFETRREHILTRPYGIERLFEGFDHTFFDAESSNIAGVPDCCIAIKAKLDFPAKAQKNIRLLISAGANKKEAVQNIIKLRNSGYIEKRKSAKSPISHDSIEGRLSSVLLPQILFGKNVSGESLAAISTNTHNTKRLWVSGISGDLPIVLMEINSLGDAERARSYISCHQKLRICGIVYDLVFLYHEGGEYNRAVTNMLLKLILEIYREYKIDVRGGVHLTDTASCGEEISGLLRAAACHIAPRDILNYADVNFKYKPVSLRECAAAKNVVPNGYKLNSGMFYKESFFPQRDSGSCGLPWCHVLANPQFGVLLSDKALGYTWAINSRENKLTPWYNDPMSDNRGELLAARVKDKCYDLILGTQPEFNPDYAKYSGIFEDIQSTAIVTVPRKGMVKYLDVTLNNTSDETREIEIAYYIEPVMGVSRNLSGQISGHIEDNILFLRNPFNQAVKSMMGLTCNRSFYVVADRPSFLCARWDKPSLPPQHDVCAALIVKLTLPPGADISLKFTMAFACSEQGVIKQLKHCLKPVTTVYSHQAAGNRKNRPANKHRNQLSNRYPNRITISTPDNELNYMFNTWLPWQTLAGRIYGRTGFFQCGGAFGFRDQLQDVCAFTVIYPDIAKRHIIRACAAQFEEGDVLHWWHNLPKYGGGKKGVRTRYSDDLLWLPYAVCEYLDATGDYSILDIPVRYLSAPELGENENERYIETGFSELKEPVFSHCVRAINRACRFGERSLPLMGGGDWNDGYNRVGEHGAGESVWLAQFLSIVLTRFAGVCEKTEKYNQTETSGKYHTLAQELLSAVDKHCWDGEHYIRAFFDNGAVMGKNGNDECSIDSLTQSFSVIAGSANLQRRETALASVYRRLVDDKNGIVKLFTPAFEHSEQNPGYVKSYPAGVRENGGQYTHAAVWYAKALLMSGDIERGYAVLGMLNPAKKYTIPQETTDSSQFPNAYALEPYYMAADVYTNPNCYGRAGWSIYTGAAAWYWRTVAENLLGIQIKDGYLCISPVIPADWDGFSASVEIGEFSCDITVKYGEKTKIHGDEKNTEYIKIDQKSHKSNIIINKKGANPNEN
ncbi:MAG: hypothetical protein FWG69_03815 [Oscillospiraceae bacterium]|nr:hypothetical protein [Oscillospiraceae bacterium]